MSEFLKQIVGWLADEVEGEETASALCAYLLVPGLVLLTAAFIVGDQGLGAGLEKPLAVARIQSAITPGGDPQTGSGLVMILEPTDFRFRLPLESTDRAGAWTSLEPEVLKADPGAVQVDSTGITANAPFLGENRPVAIVTEGSPAGKIQLPGRTDVLEAWRLTSRRSSNLMFTVLAASAFGFGISLARFRSPVSVKKKHGDGEVGGQKDKN